MYQVSVYLHLLAAVVWVGGMFFLALVLVPALRARPEVERARLLGVAGRRFRTIGWVCIGLLVLTGLINSGYRGLTWEAVLSGAWLGARFGQILALKLLLVLVLVGMSALHDFVVGPASVRASESSEPGAAAQRDRLRRQASVLGRVNGLLALAILALAVLLVRPGF